MLELRGIEAAYGESRVLFGVGLEVGGGEIVTLMGRNGMGKTTTVRTILGLLPPRAGSIRFLGTEIAGLPPHQIARLGIGLVPEGRRIFASLTVEENLRAVMRRRAGGGWTVERVFALFPALAERRRNMGHELSGGEQQMLAIGRALVTNPRLLVLDEATEGLAPLVRRDIWRALAELAREGLSMLVIDKQIAQLLAFARRHFIIEKGRIVWSGTSAEFRADPRIRQRYLGL